MDTDVDYDSIDLFEPPPSAFTRMSLDALSPSRGAGGGGAGGGGAMGTGTGAGEVLEVDRSFDDGDDSYFDDEEPS